jgi:hypothetical protein
LSTGKKLAKYDTFLIYIKDTNSSPNVFIKGKSRSIIVGINCFRKNNSWFYRDSLLQKILTSAAAGDYSVTSFRESVLMVGTGNDAMNLT